MTLFAAYGNATMDVEAYGAAGAPKARTSIIGTNAGKQGTASVSSYTAHLPAVKALPAAAVRPPSLGW